MLTGRMPVTIRLTWGVWGRVWLSSGYVLSLCCWCPRPLHNLGITAARLDGDINA